MKTIILTIFFAMLFATTISANSNNINELSNKGVELIFDMQFEQANMIFDEMIRMDPENAMGYFLKSKSYTWLYVFGTNDKEHMEKFLELSLKTIDIAKEMLDKNEDDIDALYYIGNAYLYNGRWYGETGSWIKAFWYGRKGTNYLKKVIKKDPDYYDAYFGLGMYHYYADVLPKFIKAFSFLLGGVEGDREKGIDEVILASTKGNLTRGEAKLLLAVEIYLDYEKNFEAALPLLNKLTTEYPHNHFFNLSLADCYRNLYKYDLSVQTFRKVFALNNIKEDWIKPWYHYYLANCYRDIGETEKANQEYDIANEYNDNTIRSDIDKDTSEMGKRGWGNYE